MFFRLIYESFRFAWQNLKANVLRTVLSLLGVTVGIFAIIAVLTAVDSMEANVKQSLSVLGDKVIYVSKWPFIFTPTTPWWKYLNRPALKYQDYKYLENALLNQRGVAIFNSKGNITLKNKNNSRAGCDVQGISYSYNVVSDLPIEKGRYFSPQEVETAKEVAIIGAEIASTLFPDEDPIGKTFKIRGLNFLVVAVLKKQGSSLLGNDYDEVAYIPYNTYSKMFITRYSEPMIAVKGLDTDEGLMELEGELTGVLRSKRGLKPSEEDNFSLNRPEMVANAVASIFGVLNAAGWFIGGFSVLVGAFGIANIMFVSVREQTNIIGIQKSLGAKNYFILFQFLFEALFLSFLGGFIGFFLVWLITLIPQDALPLTLTFKNIMIGSTICLCTGVLAGIVPAYVAARMDPVIAIRSK
jgi:putative ABC transport system permease protein